MNIVIMADLIYVLNSTYLNNNITLLERTISEKEKRLLRVMRYVMRQYKSNKWHDRDGYLG